MMTLRISNGARTLVGLFSLIAASSLAAQSLPMPNTKPAPGNEIRPAPPHQMVYRPEVYYQLECGGCHLGDGEGKRNNDIPRMKNFVGHFLSVEGGREFLVQVPGSAYSSFADDQLAELINWIITDGIAGTSKPETFTPYTAEEVATLRAQPLGKVEETRDVLLDRMRAKDIAIHDGLKDRP
uniref:cytochrome C n=1 Tax=uncultured Halomonas sp. TaxID=173971 RepID=UPI002635BEB4|nr:cytochrome C [uncultured Halomonas sp.]